MGEHGKGDVAVAGVASADLVVAEADFGFRGLSSLAWDRAHVQRLARHLGYLVIWPELSSVLPLFDQVRAPTWTPS